MTKTERREHLKVILDEQGRTLTSLQKAIRHLFMANAAALQLGAADQVQMTPAPSRAKRGSR